MEKTLKRRLRSEAVINGRTQKEGHPEFARPGLYDLKKKLGEKEGQKIPDGWNTDPIVPDHILNPDKE
jgi:hydroxymethylglutaryl-CoA lyase